MARRDEQEALLALRRATGPVWPLQVGIAVALAVVLVLLRRLVSDESWAATAAFTLPFILMFALLWGWGERRRRRLRESAADSTRAESGVITGKDQGWVTVRGEAHEVGWKPDSAIGLRVGDPVWAAPRIAPGERIVLVRAASSHGLLQDVVGPCTEAVAVDAPPEPSVRDGILDD